VGRIGGLARPAVGGPVVWASIQRRAGLGAEPIKAVSRNRCPAGSVGRPDLWQAEPVVGLDQRRVGLVAEPVSGWGRASC